MKGLFLKDLRNVWKAVIACIIIIFIQVAAVNLSDISNATASEISFVVAWMIVLYGSIIPTMLLSDDDKSGFLKYTKVLPVNKWLVVAEKYIMSISIELIIVLIGMLNIYICDFGSGKNLWTLIYVAFPLGLLFNGIIMTLITALGIEKSGGWAFAIIMLLMIILVIVSGITESDYDVGKMIYNARGYILAAGVVCYGVMYIIATKAYIKREY